MESGAQGRIRTTDTRIFSPLLYQLSYLGVLETFLNENGTLRTVRGIAFSPCAVQTLNGLSVSKKASFG